MKKILLLSICIIVTCICTPLQGNALEFKIRGIFSQYFENVDGGNFMRTDRHGNHVHGQQWSAVRNNRDSFDAVLRYFLYLDAIASENLRAHLWIDIGTPRFGHATYGGALGADSQAAVGILSAYVE